ncbi:unnamed protein product, partial [Ixodes hexagonus]
MAAYHHLKAPAAAYSVNGIGLHASPGVDLLHPGYPGRPGPVRPRSCTTQQRSSLKPAIPISWFPSHHAGHPPIRLDKYRDEWDSQMIEEVWYGSSGCPS